MNKRIIERIKETLFELRVNVRYFESLACADPKRLELLELYEQAVRNEERVLRDAEQASAAESLADAALLEVCYYDELESVWGTRDYEEAKRRKAARETAELCF